MNGSVQFFPFHSKFTIQHSKFNPVPDPILILADLKSPIPFTHAGTPGVVVPQFTEAGSRRHHPRFFYAEFPADSTGSWYQIDASRLAAICAAGATTRAFTAHDVAALLQSVNRSFILTNLLKELVPKS